MLLWTALTGSNSERSDVVEFDFVGRRMLIARLTRDDVVVSQRHIPFDPHPGYLQLPAHGIHETHSPLLGATASNAHVYGEWTYGLGEGSYDLKYDRVEQVETRHDE
jgi:hypothetical protein